MAVIVNKEECIGCSACVSCCPFGAIVMEDDKACITAACTMCGACVDVCPVTAITKEVEEVSVKVDKNAYKDVWVFIEQVDGQIKSVSHELLGEGRKLADAMGQKLAGVNGFGRITDQREIIRTDPLK